MILKGQNFRILTFDGYKYKVIGMATGCTVNLNTNTDDASHKDITDMAAVPTVTSKSWSVSVDSLNVVDAASMLTAIKSLTPFTLIWDETSTTDNQTPVTSTTFARKGTAFLNDATFTFDNRTNSTKQLQFAGSGPLESLSETPEITSVAVGSYTKGETVRLYLSDNNTDAPSKVIAAARTLSLHVSLTMESASTTDTPGDYDIQEPTGLSYDISTSALVRGSDNIETGVPAGQALSDIETIYEGSAPVKWKICNVSGDNHRTAGSTIVSGSAIVSQLTLNGPNRQAADYTCQLTGYGAYTVGS